jgi:VanZ family protein
MSPRFWAPPVAWMGVILLLSSDLGSGAETGRILGPLLRWAWPAASPLQIEALHALVRKGAHVVEYAVLAALWFRALARGGGRSPRVAAWAAVAISAAWAGLDEAHQALYPSRGSSLGDVGLDTAAAAAAAGTARAGWRAAVDRATSVVLWIAAAGGVLVGAMHLALDISPGWLWITTPAAALVLALRRLR